MARILRAFAAQAREELAENRVSRGMVLVLVIAGLAALAASGNGSAYGA